MNELSIRRASPREAGAMALLKASHGLMDSLYPDEAGYYLPIEGLCMPALRSA